MAKRENKEENKKPGQAENMKVKKDRESKMKWSEQVCYRHRICMEMFIKINSINRKHFTYKRKLAGKMKTKTVRRIIKKKLKTQLIKNKLKHKGLEKHAKTGCANSN